MSRRGVFVTGTDTGVGKTLVSQVVMEALKLRGLRVGAMKPVASGCESTPEGLRNDDALALQAACSESTDYTLINPYAFAPPIAPHLAANDAGVHVSLDAIVGGFAKLSERVDCMVVEGAGGWRVPINNGQTLADVAVALDLPVILVVGMRLGCINHALLTEEAIARDGLRCVGWVANETAPTMSRLDDNVAALTARLRAPLLGRLPWMERPDPVALASLFDLSLLDQ